jgi:hypothetical protein
MTRFRRWPLAARIELTAAATWIVLGVLGGVALGARGGTVGTLWGTTISQRPPAVLIALNVVLAGVLLALPFLAIGIVLVGRGPSRVRAGSLAAWILALLCLGVAVAGIAGELVRGSTVPELLDRAGGAAVVFGLCAVVHAISGVAATRGRAPARRRPHSPPLNE